MADFLRDCEQGSNERVSVEFSTRGIAGVARAINAQLDAQRDARIAEEARRAAFQQDLAALSHDIRTPLAGAQGYLQLHARSDDAAEQQRCLDEAASRLAAMRELTDRLFEYSKAIDEQSPLAMSAVEVHPVLASVLAGLYPQFVERGWEPSVDFENEGVTVRADAEALSRVFANVLSNALRYGSEAPHIAQRGSVLVVANAVADPSSIDPDRLFDRFYRADASRPNGGSGLGLAIVAELCARMDGHASARLEGNELVIELALCPVGAH